VKINVHIERIVIEDIAVENSASIGAAVRTELVSRLAEGGVSPVFRQPGAHSFVNGGHIPWNKSKGEAHLGKYIATAIYSGIGAKK
jgi:hypothetical protein